MPDRPTDKVIVPSEGALMLILPQLIAHKCTFTVEPSLTRPGTWHVGLFPDGVKVVTDLYGPAKEIGFEEYYGRGSQQ